ncbi:hypothetical protein [Roseovarius aestuariivivens]|uniref:hypothetical protein n=1 Tax=Roseovarius aestuariivivens TaxID=1888910 RepID=UPI001FD8D2F2|nr:hypothetical protein [Roseovarius aestuariivivens]
MRRLLYCSVAFFALAACQEDEAAPAEESGNGSSESTQSAQPETTPAQTQTQTEDTATADDGGGAMADAPEPEEDAPAEASSQDAVAPSEVTQDAIDGCIDALRAQEGAVGGTVQSTEFSEANSLVMLEDANGTTWRCLVSNDGSGASIEAQGGSGATEDTATADDGGGAMAGSEAETADDGGGAMAGSEEAAPSAGSPSDVTGFVGARAGQAEGGLAALGFEAIRSEGLTTFWFNRDTGACARITTSDGVFSDIEMLPAEDC